MSDFAKIFRHPEHGQVLVYRDNGDDGPELVFTVEIDGVMCRTGIGFPDDDDGEEKRRRAFERCDEAFARKVADTLFRTLQETRNECPSARADDR